MYIGYDGREYEDMELDSMRQERREQQKMSHAEIVSKTYELISALLYDAVENGTLDEMCLERGLSNQDALRISKQATKVAQRLNRQAH